MSAWSEAWEQSMFVQWWRRDHLVYLFAHGWFGLFLAVMCVLRYGPPHNFLMYAVVFVSSIEIHVSLLWLFVMDYITWGKWLWSKLNGRD